MYSKIHFKIKLFLVIILITGLYIYFSVKHQQLEDTKLSQQPISYELSVRYKKINDGTKIEKLQNYSIWWNEDGYTYSVPTEENIIVSRFDDKQNQFSKELSIATQVFKDRGYINISTSTDTILNNYYYTKDSSLCSININTGINSFAVACSDISTLNKSKLEQKPILNFLNLKNNDIAINILSTSGDFIQVNEQYRPGGYTDILKKEGSSYRLIIKTQEAPTCDLIQKEKIPKDVLTSIGNGGCYYDNGTKYKN